MGLFDQMLGGALSSMLGQGGGGGLLGAALGSGGLAEALPGLVEKALAKTPFGNLEGLLAQLNEGGLGDEVSSWLSTGQNIPVSADEIVAAIGPARIEQVASAFGFPAEQIPALLAQYLPMVVDKLSPDGVLQPPAA